MDLSEKPYTLSLSYEAKLGEVSEASTPVVIWVPWNVFHFYYRGKRKPGDGPLDPLDKSKIERISIMCRSMFGKQFGHFSAQAKSIATFSVSNISSVYPRAPFIPLKSAPNTGDGAEDTQIFHRLPSKPPSIDIAQEDKTIE